MAALSEVAAAVSEHVPCVGELAEAAFVFPADSICEDLERCFARNPNTSSVVIEHPAGRLEILTRRRLTVELAGRLGHGRSLYGHRPVHDLPGLDETLIVDASTPAPDAGALVLARRPGHRYDDLIVTRADGEVGTVSVARLFGELARMHAHRAVHDRLTGLPNREFFIEQLRTSSCRVAALFIDLDDFKAVNDSLGHSAGDELLTVVARRRAAAAAATAPVARLSGDEFGGLQPGGDEHSARRAAQRIIETLSRPVTLLGKSVEVSASIGIAVTSGEDIEMLLRNADIAMYAAKQHGKRRYTVYHDEMFRQVSRQMELRTDLDGALARGELRLVYQPIVTLAGGQTMAVEALLRWRHPRLGDVPPLEFVKLAEESNAIVAIGNWVIEEACRQVLSWEREHGYAVPVAVNVSTRQLERRAFPSEVRQLLARIGLAPDRLCLEITETAVATDAPLVVDVLDELATTGVTLAIDDFGTGHSSLERIERLPVRILKLDRGFAARLEQRGDERLLHGLRALADAMGVETVVEGIETDHQQEAVARLGYHLAQGFHFARPLEADDLIARLETEGHRPVTRTAPPS